MGSRFALFFEHQGVVLALFDPAQINGVRRSILDMEPEGFLVECPAAREVRHPQREIAGTHDVERRFVDVPGNRLHDLSAITCGC